MYASHAATIQHLDSGRRWKHHAPDKHDFDDGVLTTMPAIQVERGHLHISRCLTVVVLV